MTVICEWTEKNSSTSRYVEEDKKSQERGDGFCQKFRGNTCAKFFGNQSIYVTSEYSQGVKENNFISKKTCHRLCIYCNSKSILHLLNLSMSAVIKDLIEVLNQYIRSKKKRENEFCYVTHVSYKERRSQVIKMFLGGSVLVSWIFFNPNHDPIPLRSEILYLENLSELFLPESTWNLLNVVPILSLKPMETF